MRICCVCGSPFESPYKRTLTCSPECSKKYRNRNRHRELTEEQKLRRKEYDRQKYLKSHPDARTAEDIHEQKIIKEALKKERYEAQQQEWAKIRAHKEVVKQVNIAYWLEYEAEHECEVCKKKYIAHYPTSKYCSKTCARRNTKTRDSRNRYKNKIIDKGISLPKLADRDHNQCQICGLFVDWNDYIETDKTVICGDMYPSIDHIRPISLGGLHSWDNVQLAHRGCNTRKSNKYIG